MHMSDQLCLCLTQSGELKTLLKDVKKDSSLP